jgi:DNA-binding MarR family transcriptional regulator
MQPSVETRPSVAATTSERLFRLLRSIILSPEIDHFSLIDENDLTVSQVRATMTLACADPEPLSGARLAERLGISAPAMSRTLDGLVQKGFVERTESSADRRVRLLNITAAGRDLAEGLTALRHAQIDRFLDGLTGEQTDRLADALESLDSGHALGANVPAGREDRA